MATIPREKPPNRLPRRSPEEREAELVVHLHDGRTNRKSFKKGWVARLLDMIGRH